MSRGKKQQSETGAVLLAPRPVYSFRDGSRVKGVEAESVGAELERIHREYGEVTPPVVVEQARDPENPMHAAFNWDDAAAAHEHRLQQARTLIRAVVVRYEPDREPEPYLVHVTYSDPDGKERGAYKPVEVVVRDADLYESAREELAAKLAGSKRAFRELQAAYHRAGIANPAREKQVETVGQHLDAAIKAASEPLPDELPAA